jgi:dihydrofolate reductase
VFIGLSVDGCIARPDDELDWLEEASGGGDAEDHGYDAFMEDVDVVLMGRRTYEVASGFPSWPYRGRRVIVASCSLPSTDDAPPGGVEVTAEAPVALLTRLRRQGVRKVYLDGGRLITAYLEAGLVDELTLTRLPIVLGAGLPLFGRIGRPVRLRHAETRTFASGLVQSRYEVLPRRDAEQAEHGSDRR